VNATDRTISGRKTTNWGDGASIFCIKESLMLGRKKLNENLREDARQIQVSEFFCITP